MELLCDMGDVEPHFFPYGESVSVGARQVHGLPQTQAQKLFWTHLVVPLGDKAQVEPRFGPFGESANLDARQLHGLRRTYHRPGHRFGRTRWNSQVTWVIWNLASFHLETVLVSVQERCMVCTYIIICIFFKVQDRLTSFKHHVNSLNAKRRATM